MTPHDLVTQWRKEATELRRDGERLSWSPASYQPKCDMLNRCADQLAAVLEAQENAARGDR